MTADYPIRFAPIFKSMLWGGRRLPEFVGFTPPHDDPIGEAWMLSDVPGSLSVIANGEWHGRTLRDLIAEDPVGVFGERIPADGRFPLLFKFIDARQELSVQVHPNDALAEQLKGPGYRGKTEAWVILDADPATSKIYAGFKDGMTENDFRAAMANGTTPETLHSFTPKRGDCVFLEAGTVHAIGANILLFEVQQTSDITFRLFDWHRVDAKTGQPRELHIDHGLICSNFTLGPREPVNGEDETMVACPYFELHRRVFTELGHIGPQGECRVIACIGGSGTLGGEPIRAGDLVLLPAKVGRASVVADEPLMLLECGLGCG